MSGGGSKSRGSDVSAIMPYIAQYQAESQPLAKEQLSQALEALQTGGVGARIPLIQSAQAQSQNALGQTLQNLRDQFAARGMTNSPFAQSAIAGTEMQGRQQIAGIPAQVAGQAVSGGQSIFQNLVAAMSGAKSGYTHSKSSQGGL